MNYYELLGVEKTASEEEIKTAYKKEIKKWHPDINKDKDAISISMKLNEAKEILLDINKRKEYDMYLENKEQKTYQKYTNTKPQEETKTNVNAAYEETLLTKWQYLKEYLKNKNIKIFRRILALFLTLLESLFCFILKCLIIILSFICFILSSIIIFIFTYTYPFIIILIIYLIYIWIKKGFDELITFHLDELKSIVILIFVYGFGFLLNFLGKALISPTVFDFLYNKLDVFLFKKSVGYK